MPYCFSRPRVLLVLSLILALWPTGAQTATAGAVEPVYDARSGLAQGWMDFGWSPHRIIKGKAVELDLAGFGGWILSKPGVQGQFGALVFRYRAPASFETFLEVRLESGSEHLPEIAIGADEGVLLPDGLREVSIPMLHLNPTSSSFDKLVLRAGLQDEGVD